MHLWLCKMLLFEILYMGTEVCIISKLIRGGLCQTIAN